jgi:hypothetical protein
MQSHPAEKIVEIACLRCGEAMDRGPSIVGKLDAEDVA